ncbi:MAG: hypothetical protein K0R84_839 [Clostridia bacterium]|jgi:hypothetical protein|nr:hypothetical protein [Clostridia bacterium]
MAETISDNKILDSFNNLIPYLQYFFEDDIAMGINDCEKCLRFESHENIPTNVETGDLIRPGSATYECTRSGEKISLIVPKEVFGVGLKSIAVPVKDETGKVVGSFSIARSLKRQEEMLDISRTLSLELMQISKAISDVAEGIQLVADSNVRLAKSIDEAKKQTKDTDDILKFIRGVVEQTNLLGLNAAIEAARAGEAGRGFSIVAQEVRKLSSSTGRSVNDIKEVLEKMQDSVIEISKSINESNGIFQEQAAAVQQINASVQELTSTANYLEGIASKL